jgi:hypothetical protein
MQGFSLGAGLASLAFWGFIAAVVVAGIWYDIRKREAQHETVRRVIESGQKLDEELVDKLLSLSGSRSDRLDRGFQITGLIMLPAAVGLAIFGYVMGIRYPQTQLPLLGVAALVACIGLGFLLAAVIARRWYREGQSDLSGI